MRTIITNDIENKIQTTEKISLTKKGVIRQIQTAILGDNEAAELRAANTTDVDSPESVDYNTLIRNNGDVIYCENSGVTRTVTKEGYIVYDFPTDPNKMVINLECDDKGLISDKVILNFAYSLYMVGFNFFEISPYSKDTRFLIFINTYYVGAIKYDDLINSRYKDITQTAPEDADEETKELYAKIHRLYGNLNSYKFGESQVDLKIYVADNENSNARGMMTLRFQTFEVDEEGNIITDSITKILNGGDATGE